MGTLAEPVQANKRLYKNIPEQTVIRRHPEIEGLPAIAAGRPIGRTQHGTEFKPHIKVFRHPEIRSRAHVKPPARDSVKGIGGTSLRIKTGEESHIMAHNQCRFIRCPPIAEQTFGSKPRQSAVIRTKG